MIVECPRCQARYRVDDELVREDPTFKCSRCSHLFGLAETAAAEPPEDSPLVEDEPDEEPNEDPMTESEPSNDEPALPFRADDDPADEPEVDIPARRDPPGAGREPRLPLDDAGDDEPSFSFTAREGEDDDDLAFDDDEDSEDDGLGSASGTEPRFVRPSIERGRADGPRSLPWAMAMFLGLLLVLYANAALYLRNNTAVAKSVLGWLPLAGDAISDDGLVKSRIHLVDVEASWEETKNGHRVLVVSGRAMNTSSLPVKRILIEGSVVDGAGQALQTRSVYGGAPITPKTIHNANDAMIDYLQRQTPLQRFRVEPGEDTGFSVVFLKPPLETRNFTLRVRRAEWAEA